MSTSTTPSVECSTCWGRGYALQVSPTRQDWWETLPCPDCEAGRNEVKRLEASRLKALFGYAKIPTMYERAAVEDFSEAVQRKAQDAVGGTSLFLHGPAGTGKTHLAIAVLKRRLGQNKTGLFTTGPDLWDAIRRGFDNKGPSADELLEAVRTVDCLVLDDMGAEKLSEWVREKTYQIVNYRHNWGLQTIVSSNKSFQELSEPESIGDRTVSRLMGMCQVIRLGGPDRRLGKTGKQGGGG